MHPERLEWRPVPGVYIFAGLNLQGLWVAHYVGRTHSLAERMSGHEEWLDAVLLGATHVHARVVPRELDRFALEHAVWRRYGPSLNDVRPS